MSFRFEDESAPGNNAHVGDRSPDGCNPQHFPVLEYIERNGDRLDGQLYSAIRHKGDVRKIGDVCTGRMHDTDGGVEIMRWRLWGRRATETCFILVRRTVQMSVVLRESGTRVTKATFLDG